MKFGELRDVLSPRHRIHDRRNIGRRSDLLKLPIIYLTCFRVHDQTGEYGVPYIVNCQHGLRSHLTFIKVALVAQKEFVQPVFVFVS